MLPNQTTICPHVRNITECDICYLVKEQHGRYPTADDKMEEEIADMEDQLLNTDRRTNT